jgi:hypothetical protein
MHHQVSALNPYSSSSRYWNNLLVVRHHYHNTSVTSFLFKGVLISPSYRQTYPWLAGLKCLSRIKPRLHTQYSYRVATHSFPQYSFGLCPPSRRSFPSLQAHKVRQATDETDEERRRRSSLHHRRTSTEHEAGLNRGPVEK